MDVHIQTYLCGVNYLPGLLPRAVHNLALGISSAKVNHQHQGPIVSPCGHPDCPFYPHRRSVRTITKKYYFFVGLSEQSVNIHRPSGRYYGCAGRIAQVQINCGSATV